MQATILDLRYRMNDVLKALERNESVSVLYRGKIKGILSPVQGETGIDATKHPFFGMNKDTRTAEAIMDDLRGGRYRDI